MKISWERKNIRSALILIVIVRVVILIFLDQHTYWTFDEPWNTETAKQVLVEKQFRRTKDSFTPISIGNVWLGEQLRKNFPSIDTLSSYRVAGIALNQAAVPLLYGLAVEVGASEANALFFTALLSFDPNILGHTVLAANVDGYIFTWFLLLAVVALYWARKPRWQTLQLFGLILGLAQGVKLTSAYAVPLCLIWVFYILWKKKVPRAALNTLFFLFFSWLGLCLFYAFNKIGTPFGDIHFVSKKFQSLAEYLKNIPTPIPVDYLQGLDMCLQTDTVPRPVYIRDTFLLHGVWYYFFYALLIKTPLPTLVSSIVGWTRAVRTKKIGIPQTFLLIFIFCFMIYFSFFFNAQIGIRYLFPIYGFMMIGMIWFPWKKATYILASLWIAGTLAYNWPNFIGYFNELVPVKHHRWWHLGDSNLTWNQEWKDWPAYIGEHHLTNDQIGPPTFPIGTPFYEDAITISGVLSNRQQLKVMRDHFQPFDSFWGTKLEYLVTPEQVLKEFPSQSVALTSQKETPCDQKGWRTENGDTLVENLPNDLIPVGRHKMKSFMLVPGNGAVFIELASKNEATLSINEADILSTLPPWPRLSVKSVKLPKGRYDLTLNYEKSTQDGFVSVRVFEIQTDPTPFALPLSFCVPLSDNNAKERKGAP